MSRKYYLQCPYCDKRLEREDLVIHIDKDHTDMIPEGYTPLQITYHVANKRSLDNPRKCRVCGRPCPWDEKKGRYDQLCGRPECKKKQAENMGKDMGDKLRSNSPTQSVDGLEKMLAGRSISKKYIWRDGTVFTYTGSYEGNFLKWIDTVMETKSEDWMIPGPAIYYEYEGEEHLYIPDAYYIPYNLIVEVKDGGDRPNTSTARRDSRLKTIAKEKHIINKTQYNYIRLTNNDFSQLLAIFADLKMNLIDNRQSRVIHVNEHMAQASVTPMVGMNDIVLVDYVQNKAFCGKSSLAISNTGELTDLFGIDHRGRLDRIYREGLVNGKYNAYIITGVREKVENFLKENINTEMDSDRIYEAVFGHKRCTHDQILFESDCYPCKLFESVLQEGLFNKKNRVDLSDFKKVPITKENAEKYDPDGCGKYIDSAFDKFDGFYFINNEGKIVIQIQVFEKLALNKNELRFHIHGLHASNDSPLWNELGNLIIEDLKAELFWISSNDKNQSEESALENLKKKDNRIGCLLENGMKIIRWPKAEKYLNNSCYFWLLYIGTVPNLNASPKEILGN